MEWYEYAVSRQFSWTDTHRTYHSGIDLAVPWNTRVTAPLAGTVVFAECRPWGGQVDVLTTWRGLPYVVTVLHLHSILVNKNQQVAAGQLLGYSGGDGRGPCPTQMPKYSNGPHVHLETTLGSVGPYHGGPPYKVNANSFTVNPMPLLVALRGNEASTGRVESGGLGSEPIPAGASSRVPDLPDLAALFAVPQASVDVLNSLPGLDNLVYRLHDAETFPGWRSLDQVAPMADTATAALTGASNVASVISEAIPGSLGSVGASLFGGAAQAAASASSALNPGRIVYWITGNVLGNARAGFVRLLYLGIGGMLFLALVIALGSAQMEVTLDTVEEIAPAVAGAATLVA